MVEALILLILLMVLVFAGLPVALAMTFSGLVGIIAFLGPDFLIAGGRVAWNALYSWLLVTAFLFILIAELMNRPKVGDVLFEGMSKFASGIRGALAMAVIWGCTLMGVTTGSGIAEVASVGRVAIPAMLKRGYSKTLALGSATASGALGYLIPPSLFLIIYAAWAGESVGLLFAAAMLPGLLMASLLTGTTALLTTLNPKIAPRVPSLPIIERAKGLFMTWPVLTVGLTILGVIIFGIATPVEASGIGVIFIMVIILARPVSRRLVNWTFLKESMVSATWVTSSLMFILVGASILSFAWSYLGAPVKVVAWISGMAIPPFLTLIIFYLIVIAFGCVMEGLSMMLLIMPVALPLMDTLGYDRIWLGVIMGFLVAAAELTPPVGIHLFTIKTLFPEHKFWLIVRGAFPYFLAEIVAIALLSAFPQIALWLPSLIKGD